MTDVEQLLLSELRAIREDVGEQGLMLARVDQRLQHIERRSQPEPEEAQAPGLSKAGKAALAGAGAVLGGALAAALQAFVK